MSALRAVRALRPLRTVSRLPGMRRQVNTLIEALPALADVLMLSGFFLVISGVLGVQLFAGELRRRCRGSDTWPPIDEYDYGAAAGVCVSDEDCADGGTCELWGGNPADGTMSFDTILAAWMTLTTVVTMEGWSAVAIALRRVGGSWGEAYVYVNIVFGNMYVLNLLLAVTWHTYQTQRALEAESAGRSKKSTRPGTPQLSSRAITPAPSPDKVLRRQATRHYDAEAGGDIAEASEALRRVVKGPAFSNFVMGLVVLNMLLMMCERHPQPEEQVALMEKANLFFTAAFTVEMCLKLFALGLREYWADTFNRFDGVIVVASLFEIAAAEMDLPINAQALRALRLLRVFKLLKAWKSLQRLLGSLLRALHPLMWLMLLFALILFIFALLGMQFFGDQLSPDAQGYSPRPNFDSIGDAMLAVSIVSTQEDWNEIWRTVNSDVGSVSSLYFVALVVVGAFLLMNLIVATLIGSFDSSDSSEPPSTAASTAAPSPTGSPRGSPFKGEEDDADVALGCLRRSNPLRRAATAFITARCRVGSVGVTFDTIILTVILVSSGAMALQSCTLDPESELAAGVYWVDLAATMIFTCELLVKVVALGLYATPNAYLKSRWHQLDIFVVTTSLLAIFAGSSPAFRVLRVLRVLRPLRLLTMIPAMKMVTGLLLSALPRVLDVAAVYVLFLAIFAVLGVQLFGGKLASCEGAPEYSTRAECEAAGEAWAPPAFGSFDNVGASALLLFEVSTLEGWPDVLFACVDAHAVDEAPSRAAGSRASAVFLLAWVVMGAMCLVNLFVGVLVQTFDVMRRKEESVGIMSAGQKQWAEAMEQMLATRPKRRPPRPAAAWRASCHRLATNPKFEVAILGVILFNTLLMALDGFGNPPLMVEALAHLNTACTLIFICEASIKIRQAAYLLLHLLHHHRSSTTTTSSPSSITAPSRSASTSARRGTCSTSRSWSCRSSTWRCNSSPPPSARAAPAPLPSM